MKTLSLLKLAGGLAAVGVIYGLWLRPRHLRWGATGEEFSERLPGDERTPQPRGRATNAVTIRAPASKVWKWPVQIGSNRGGFYSYSWLENLVGCRLRNATRIVPEFQNLHATDSVWLHPKVSPLPIVHFEKDRALVLGSNTSAPGTWGFYLTPQGANATRLLVRNRGDWKSGLLRSLFQYAVCEPIHVLMERKMLLTIKRLAERAVGE